MKIVQLLKVFSLLYLLSFSTLITCSQIKEIRRLKKTEVNKKFKSKTLVTKESIIKSIEDLTTYEKYLGDYNYMQSQLVYLLKELREEKTEKRKVDLKIRLAEATNNLQFFFENLLNIGQMTINKTEKEFLE